MSPKNNFFFCFWNLSLKLASKLPSVPFSQSDRGLNAPAGQKCDRARGTQCNLFSCATSSSEEVRCLYLANWNQWRWESSAGLVFVVCGRYSEQYITGVYGCKIINLGEGKKAKNKFMQWSLKKSWKQDLPAIQPVISILFRKNSVKS